MASLFAEFIRDKTSAFHNMQLLQIDSFYTFAVFFFFFFFFFSRAGPREFACLTCIAHTKWHENSLTPFKAWECKIYRALCTALSWNLHTYQQYKERKRRREQKSQLVDMRPPAACSTMYVAERVGWLAEKRLRSSEENTQTHTHTIQV